MKKEKKEGVYLIIVSNKKILLVKKKDIWILPGGKREKGETLKETLERELNEEIGCKIIGKNHFYGSFKGKTPHSKTSITAHIYIGQIDGKAKPKNEISAIKYEKKFEKIKISPITKKIIKSLKKDGII